MAGDSELKQRRRPPLNTRQSHLADGTYDAKLAVSHDAEGREHLRLQGPPGTPFAEFDLSNSFLADGPPAPLKWHQKRRFLFIAGGLIGAVFAWLMSETPSGMLPDLLDRQLANLGIELPTSFSDIALINDLTKNINVSDLWSPARSWLVNRDFLIGRQAAAQGHQKKHAVLLIPGIVSSGLESWGTSEAHSSDFRKRIWGTTNMVRAVLTRKDGWIRAMSLDPETGLDMEGVKVRSAQGLDAASYFVTGYWIWSKVIENLAAVDYDQNDLALAAYDWRLSYGNLQVRDKYFSRLMFLIEHNKKFSDKKTVLVGHSMGSLVVLYFFKWVESPDHGGGGTRWVEDHIAGFVNVAGTMLGVPKAMSALLSGEMRDTVELNPAGVYLLERFFSRTERAKLFRSWAGAASMWLKGGDDVWGDHRGAPDDPHNATHTGAYVYRFRPPSEIGLRDEESAQPNLTMNGATTYLLESTSSAYQRMLESNWSFGFERDPEQLVANDNDPRKWTNPLETRLPNAPSMKIYCLYGWGKPTERGYVYRHDGYERDEARKVEGGAHQGETAADGEPMCEADDLDCQQTTRRSTLDLPLRPIVYVDGSVNNDSAVPPIKSGVITGEGDGTVSLLSLGAMCVDGWQRDLYNPGRSPVITHEIKHEPVAINPRGGPKTADHIDVLGADALNKAIVDIACGREDLVHENIVSRIRDYAAKIRWNG